MTADNLPVVLSIVSAAIVTVFTVVVIPLFSYIVKTKDRELADLWIALDCATKRGDAQAERAHEADARLMRVETQLGHIPQMQADMRDVLRKVESIATDIAIIKVGARPSQSAPYAMRSRDTPDPQRP